MRVSGHVAPAQGGGTSETVPGILSDEATCVRSNRDGMPGTGFAVAACIDAGLGTALDVAACMAPGWGVG